jgi:hypothetical protein
LTRCELQNQKRSVSRLGNEACIELAVNDDEQSICNKYIQFEERDIHAMNLEIDEFYRQNEGLQYKFKVFNIYRKLSNVRSHDLTRIKPWLSDL